MPYRLRITKEEVKEQLEKMGYTNVPEETIESFRKDMLKLIKEDLRNIKKKKAQINSESSSSYSKFTSNSQPLLTSTPNTFSDIEMEKEIGAKVPIQKEVSVTDEYYSDYETDTASDYSQSFTSLRRVKSLGSVISGSTSSKISSSSLEDFKSKRISTHSKTKKVSKETKLPSYPDKPDPVNLYHFYKAHWDKFKPPGEDPRSALRWEVRAKLHYPS